jgi:hypothetical protein
LAWWIAAFGPFALSAILILTGPATSLLAVDVK